MFASIERALSSARVNSTVKLWRWNGQTYVSDRTLRDSQMTVWAVLELDDGSLLAGSADKQIRLYVDGTLLKAFVGHTDCVRALADAPGLGFLSAANDARIIMWALSGEQLREFVGHTAYVYALARVDAHRFASCGEDRMLNVWHVSHTEPTQQVSGRVCVCVRVH
jgi:phospholipase A-2-activating protein